MKFMKILIGGFCRGLKKRKVIGEGFIWLIGQWLKEAVQVHIVAVYSPCDVQNKRILLVKPSCTALVSYYHDLPNSI